MSVVCSMEETKRDREGEGEEMLQQQDSAAAVAAAAAAAAAATEGLLAQA